MSLSILYSNGIIDALEKVAAGMSLEQAQEYLKVKDNEKSQNALMAGIGGIGLGAAEGLADATPISGKAMVLPGAALGYSASKVKSLFDSPKHMLLRDGSPTGRAIGGLAGTGIGAGLGAGIGSLVDNSGWGLGIGSLLGGLGGSAIGQDVGDYATERSNSDVIRKAKLQKSRQFK